MWPKHLIFLLFSGSLHKPGGWRAVTATAITTGLSLLAGCGQQGALYLPTEPAAAQRATLPETLLPGKRLTPANAVNPTNPADSAKPAPP